MYSIEIPTKIGLLSVSRGVVLGKGTAYAFKAFVGKSFEMFKDHHSRLYGDKFRISSFKDTVKDEQSKD